MPGYYRSVHNVCDRLEGPSLLHCDSTWSGALFLWSVIQQGLPTCLPKHDRLLHCEYTWPFYTVNTLPHFTLWIHMTAIYTKYMTAFSTKYMTAFYTVNIHERFLLWRDYTWPPFTLYCTWLPFTLWLYMTAFHTYTYMTAFHTENIQLLTLWLHSRSSDTVTISPLPPTTRHAHSSSCKPWYLSYLPMSSV